MCYLNQSTYSYKTSHRFERAFFKPHRPMTSSNGRMIVPGMELARYERELTKPTNWGEITFKNLKQREAEKGSVLTQVLAPPRNTVREALESHATVTGPLDGTDVIESLSEEDQLDFFTRYNSIRVLQLRNWMSISNNVLRCISVTFGEKLVELDLSGAHVRPPNLEVIFVRTTNLATLKLNDCQSLDTACTQCVVNLLHKCLMDLYVSRCPNYSTEPLLWIGGVVGLGSHCLRKLQTLDLSECPVTDRGLLAVSEGCKRLTFLNLYNCTEVTDTSVAVIIAANPRLRLLNLSGCVKITSKSVSAVGRNCHDLTSINLARCLLVTDKGIKTLAMGCKGLQAVNLAGLKKISEESMFALGDQCKGLLTMNLTGCERITINGLDALVSGLDYVEKGVSFMGFKPVDAHVERKLADHLDMVQNAAGKLQREQKAMQDRLDREQEAIRVKMINKAASTVTNYMYRYKLRMHYYRLWRNRVRTGASGMIQRLFRGYKGRLRAIAKFLERAAFRACSPFAVMIQRNVRAYLSRLHNPHVSKAIREMYVIRRLEALNAVAVGIQAQMRRHLAASLVSSHRELCQRRDRNTHDAILIMQQLARRFVSTLRMDKLRLQRDNYNAARLTAGKKIKIFCVMGMARYKARLTGDALRKFFREKWTLSIIIQKVFRGFRARERVRKIKIQLALFHYAARDIQRIFRGTRVLHWRDMRLNVIAAFVLDRHYVERKSSIAATRLRYKQYILENQRDSASEPDEEESGEEWLKAFDSARRCYYWQNFATNVITYDEPEDDLAHEKNLVDKRVKVYWVVQDNWYGGTVTRYHRRKRRHRVEYDDGDHEWINLQAECDRVQVQQDDGLWTMYTMYQSEAMQNEYRKKETKRDKQNYQEQAFRDANQWRSFIDDITHEVMFLSQVTGEIRAGLPDALCWVVQDDGIGFPCFYNVETNAIVYEDPRFVYEVDDDLAAQRRYVMQELRIAVYFCQDLWEKFTQALELGDKRMITSAELNIRNSPKTVHLSSFLIRAKVLYKQTSVVDKPMDKVVLEELDYASWLVEQMSGVIDRTEQRLLERRDNKRDVVGRLTVNSGQRVFCQHCKRETKRHLEFCPTCGKPQVQFDLVSMLESARSEKLTARSGGTGNGTARSTGSGNGTARSPGRSVKAPPLIMEEV